MKTREERLLLHTAGPYTVRPCQRREQGYIVCRDGATCATVVATFGPGLANAFERAKADADRRHAADEAAR